MRGLLSEFRQFVMRGNVVDLAVGIVIGVAASRCPNCTSKLSPPAREESRV